MGEPLGVVRMNVSVRRELKSRMDAVTVPVNWSAIASQAFEAKLLVLESRKEVKGMADVIARLKAAEEVDSNEDYQTGHQAGARWAKEDARPKELRRLHAFYDSSIWSSERYDWISDFNGDAFGIAYHVLAAIDPAGGVDRTTSEEFWQRHLGEEYPEGALLRGFVKGAIEIWQAYLVRGEPANDPKLETTLGREEHRQTTRLTKLKTPKVSESRLRPK